MVDIHLEYKLKKSKEKVTDIARNMVKFVRSLGCENAQFSPSDARRWRQSSCMKRLIFLGQAKCNPTRNSFVFGGIS
ncbi:hypothetical protein Bca101_054882 [Brassica carinata]